MIEIETRDEETREAKSEVAKTEDSKSRIRKRRRTEKRSAMMNRDCRIKDGLIKRLIFNPKTGLVLIYNSVF